MNLLQRVFRVKPHHGCLHDLQLDRIERLLHKVLNREDVLMALSEEVKAAVAEINAKQEAAVAGINEAVADIQGLHAKLDGILDQGDVEGARAALAEAQAKASALSDAVAGLKVVVDLPE